MLPPKRLGYPDVEWQPEPDDDPARVMGLHLQHHLLIATRAAMPGLSVRKLADAAGVHRNTAHRWLTGHEIMNLADVARIRFAVPRGLHDTLSAESVDLLPGPYKHLLDLTSATPRFADLGAEPPWSYVADIQGDFLADQVAGGRLQLLTAPVVAHRTAVLLDGLPVFTHRVEIDPEEPAEAIVQARRPIRVRHLVLLRSMAPTPAMVVAAFRGLIEPARERLIVVLMLSPPVRAQFMD